MNKRQSDPVPATILIVDDRPANIDILRQTLEPKGYKILAAPNGEFALRIAHRATPDLILLDVMMPGIDGFETCRRLKNNQSTADIPIIFVTAKDETKNVLEGFRVGGVDYISKPFQTEEVLIRVQTHMENSQLTKALLQTNDELRRTQAQLVQSEKMSTIGMLAGGIAHEINSPLAAILSNAQRILRFPQDIRKHGQSATLIEEAARRCKAIVKSLLKYARKSSTETEVVDVNQVVTDTLNLLNHHLSLQNIQIYTELAEVPMIQHNFTELSQVLTNLIVNAQDAIVAAAQNDSAHRGQKQEGKIIITTTADADSVSLSVTDNGTGMSEEAQRKIFDPFFTTKDVGKGTGLGLSIVAGIVERFEGHINVTSEMGRGTTFTIRFPLKGES